MYYKGSQMTTARTNVSSVSKDLLLFPNPNNGQFQIHISHEDQYEISIYNGLGQLLHTEYKRGVGLQSLDFNLAAGHYYIKIQPTKGPVLQKQFVIQP